MSETTPFRPSSEEQNQDVTDVAAEELNALSRLVESSFAEIGQSVSDELARMSTDSRQSMRDMVDGVLEDLARLAARQLIQRPLDSVLNGAVDPAGQVSSNALSSLLKRSIRNG